MAKSFAEIAQQSPDTLEATAPLPAGEYEMVCIKAQVEELRFDFGDRKEGTENLMMYFKPVQAVEVDEDDLEACENWRDQIVSNRIFIEELGDKFCDKKTERGVVYHLGIDPNDFETIEELVAACPGKHCLVTVVHSPNKKDPDRPYVNFRASAPL